MTMNDHEGEGLRNDHVVRWTDWSSYVLNFWNGYVPSHKYDKKG